MKIPIFCKIENYIRKLRKSRKSLKGSNLKKRIEELLKDREIVKLHLGCGRIYKEGWINVDSATVFNNQDKIDLVYDLSKGFPFEDSSVDYIFHEHLIEHLTREHGLEFSKKCFASLKGGGVLRIAYPDLDMLIDTYKNNYQNMDWYFEVCPERKGLTSSEIFNLDMREAGEHRHMYNKEDITKLLIQAGFNNENIKFYKVFESDNEELKKLEHRKFSVCVEGTKK